MAGFVTSFVTVLEPGITPSLVVVIVAVALVPAGTPVTVTKPVFLAPLTTTFPVPDVNEPPQL